MLKSFQPGQERITYNYKKNTYYFTYLSCTYSNKGLSLEFLKGYRVQEKTPEEGLVWFYGISTVVGYLKPNPVYIYIYIYIYIYMTCKHILQKIF